MAVPLKMNESACGSFLSSFYNLSRACRYVVVRGPFVVLQMQKVWPLSSVADETIVSIRLDGHPTLCHESVQFKSDFERSPLTMLHLDLTNTTNVTLMWINC